MSDIECLCPHCKTTVLAPRELAGQAAACPECEKDITIPAPKPPSVPPPARSASQKPASGVTRAGWICFGLGIFFAVVLFIIPIWGFLLVAAIILGIIATVQKEKSGLALLLCSIFALPTMAILMTMVMFIGGCGVIASSLNKGLANSSQQTLRSSASRHAAKRVAPKVARRTADLGTLLCRLDVIAREVEKAQTTILKDDAMARFHKAGSAMFANTEMQLQATVKDIKMVGNDKAELSFSGVDLGAYAQQSKKAMRLQPLNCNIKIPMTVEKARKVRPGQLLTLRVTPTFTPRSGRSFISIAHSVHTGLFNITVKGRKSFLGYDAGIRIRLLSYSIKNKRQNI